MNRHPRRLTDQDVRAALLKLVLAFTTGTGNTQPRTDRQMRAIARARRILKAAQQGQLPGQSYNPRMFSENFLSDETITRALEAHMAGAPLPDDKQLKRLIRGDTMAVGYSKIDVVRRLLAALDEASRL